MSAERPAVHQLLAGFMPGDGISDFARELQKIFRGWGLDSEIFVSAGHIDPRVRDLCRPWGEHRLLSKAENILIHHFGIGDRAGDYFGSVPDRKVMIFHNLTPPEYFDVLLPETATYLREGQRQLQGLRDKVDLSLTHSEFNLAELRRRGFSPVGFIHQPIDRARLELPPDPGVERRWGRKPGDLLFVGRIAPNKRFEDLLATFAYYRRFVMPEARLFLVGDAASTGPYLEHLKKIIAALELDGVVFTGHTSHAELLAYYRLGRVFLCLSEHEGFCVPVLEAMHFNLPVAARAAGAVPETLGGAGVLIEEFDPAETAELLGLLAADGPVREKIVAGQRARLEAYHSLSLEKTIRENLSRWLEPR